MTGRLIPFPIYSVDPTIGDIDDMPLPTQKTARPPGADPRDERVLLAGMPKAGKTTLLAGWYPDTTLILDTQNGTRLLDGEHFVQPIGSWQEFVDTVSDLERGQHPFRTVGIDLVDDLWTFCDEAHAGKDDVLASAANDYQRSIRTAEGVFRRQVGRLLSLPLGVWFVSHTREKQEKVGREQVTRYQPRLDGRVLTYVQGACDVVLLAEARGPRRLLHTQPSQQFEAGSRIPLPEPMDLDARKLATEMAKGLKPAAQVVPEAVAA